MYPRVLPFKSSQEGVPAYMIRVYAFYISEADMNGRKWAPASYADANAGIIRHADTGKTRSHGLMGEQAEGEDHIRMTLSTSPAMLVAVDPINRFYAYRSFEYKPPLREQVRMIFRFQLWRPEATYIGTPWTFVNGNLEGADDREEELVTIP